jgi:hypothetical protein
MASARTLKVSDPHLLLHPGGIFGSSTRDRDEAESNKGKEQEEESDDEDGSGRRRSLLQRDGPTPPELPELPDDMPNDVTVPGWFWHA